MTVQYSFIEHSYQKAVAIIQAIPDDIAQDIYALSFWLTNEYDDYRYPTLIVGYNTLTHFQSQKANTNDDLEYKWNFAYWLVDDMDRIGGKNDKIFEEVIEKGKKFQAEFIEVVIEITKRLFAQKVIEQKFGKNIPIIIHNLEYYDAPISWTKSANPPELIEEFLTFAKNG